MGLFFSQMYDFLAVLWSGPPARILMLGLDAAGKTTILSRMKLRENPGTTPTIGSNVETVKFSPCRGVSFNIYDLSRHKRPSRPSQQYYYEIADGLIFVVDSSDYDRFDEAREELHAILSSFDASQLPVVIIANKQDLPTAVKPSELIEKLSLHSFPSERWYIQSASAVTGGGIVDGMQKLSKMIKDQQKTNAI